MEYHILVLNDSNESLVCRSLLRIWGSKSPVTVVFASKTAEGLADLHLESSESDSYKDSTSDSNSYKYSLLYQRLNKFENLSHQEFDTLHNNLVKYLKVTLFRPLLLLFKKNNNFKPNILFNLKPILLYYYPLYCSNEQPAYPEDKELLYWYLEFDYNYNLIGTNRRLAELLDKLEGNLKNYDLNNQFLQSLLSILNMYLDGLLFRNLSLAKYENVLSHARQYQRLLSANLSSWGWGAHTTATTASSGGEVRPGGPKGAVPGTKTASQRDKGDERGHELEGEPERTAESEKRLNLTEYKKLFVDNRKPYHIASAIAYTNGYPHMGHAYEAIVCDVIGRYYKAFGRRVIFSTGTDEHGIKVMTTARNMSKTPIEVCNFYSNEFKKTFKKLLVEYDRFIRTTSKEHMVAAKTIWRRVFRKGDIYLGKYNGYYSVREERFIPNTEAKLTDFKDPVSGKPYEMMSESSYFFRMNRYQKKLVEHIERNRDFILPLKCRNEIMTRLKEPLEDLSISRTSFDWGIQVPKLSELTGGEGSAPAEDSELKGEWCNGDVNLGYNEDNKLFNESKFYNLMNRETVSKKVNLTTCSSNGNGSSCTSSHSGNGNTSCSSNNNNNNNNNNKSTTTTNNNNGNSTVTTTNVNESSTTSTTTSNTKTTTNNKDKDEENHVMYVWFDALSFYMTASGLGECFSEMTNWPTDLQVIGKDICWFQSVILATMCFSMEVPLTRKILAHGFIQGPDGRKMSKSLGNVVNLEELLGEVGAESFRYYLMRSTVLGADVNFDQAQLKEMYNTDLADNVGNLVHRLTSLTHKYNEGRVPDYESRVNYPFDFAELLKECSHLLLKLDLYNLLILVNAKFKELNNYLTVASPWTEKEKEKRDSVLRVMLESVYFLGHLLQPVLPETGEQLFQKLGTPKKNNVWELSLNLDNLERGSKVSVGEVLFPKFTTTS